MAKKLWFGTLQRFQWTPMPSQGLQANKNFYAEGDTFENGGSHAASSHGYSRTFEFNFGLRESAGAENLDVYTRYRQGYYNNFSLSSSDDLQSNFLYFADPMTFDQNVLPPHWASPMVVMADRSWHWPGLYASNSINLTNQYDHPSRSISFTVTPDQTYYARIDHRQSHIQPVPPDHKLYVGWSGTRSGTTGLVVEAHRKDGTGFDVTTVAPFDIAGAQRIGSTGFDGAIYDYVQMYWGGGTGVVGVASAMAQLWPSMYVPNTNGGQAGRHIEGMGITGCAFASDANVETYEFLDASIGAPRHYKGLAFTLAEVGAWA